MTTRYLVAVAEKISEASDCFYLPTPFTTLGQIRCHSKKIPPWWAKNVTIEMAEDVEREEFASYFARRFCERCSNFNPIGFMGMVYLPT